MSANRMALARTPAARVAEAMPIRKDLAACIASMHFPLSSLLREFAFQRDWAAVDRMLELA